MKTKTFNSDKGVITWVELINRKGASVVLSSLGAGIVSVMVPDKSGKLADVVLGYDDAKTYFADGPCAGKTPGRYANRIAAGKFTIGNETYTLPINNGPNHLHGGPEGFQNQIWNVNKVDENRVVFSLVSNDGDSGYPGNLKVEVEYIWNDLNELKILYKATTDAPTIVNLTNHTYFNLDGHDSGTALHHKLTLKCHNWLPTDSTLVPTGEIASVKDTPMDFTAPHELGERINDEFAALKYGKGYDNCWMIDDYDGTLKEVALLEAPVSGRKVRVFTNQPAAQVYTGNWIACEKGKGGYVYSDYDAVAIECQGCPDAPNKPNFPSQLLLPGEVYGREIVFKFE